MEPNTNILTAEQIDSKISAINSILLPKYRAKDGEYPSSMFGLRSGEAWIFELETRGFVEISGRYTFRGHPVLITRA